MATKVECEKLMKTCLSKDEQTAYNSLIVLKKRANNRQNHLLMIQCRIVPVFFQLLELVEVKNLTDRRRTTVNLLFSIFGDLCNLQECREEVYKHLYGLESLVLYFSECDHEGIQNRSCRTLANLSKHPGLCENIHKTDFMETLVSRMEATENSHHQHTYCRAVRLLGKTQHQKDRVLSHNALYHVGKLIESEDSAVRKEVYEVIEDYAVHRPTCEFATQLIRSGAFKVIVAKLSDKEDNSSFSLLCKLNQIPNIRPEFGSTGGLQTYIEMFSEVTDIPKQLAILNIVCLCCKESVNRVKVRNFGGLKILCDTLNNEEYHKIHDRVISALQCFVFDEAGLDVLLEHNLVSVLMHHLKRVAGFKSTTVNLLDYFGTEKNDSSPSAFSPGIFERFYPHLLHKQESDESKQDSNANKNVFSIDSPTYEPKSDWNMEEYRSGAKCKEMFKNGDTRASSVTSMSPLSTVSFNSPSLSSASDFSPPSSPGEMASSAVNSDPSYPVVFSMSYKTDASSLGGYSPGKGECGNSTIEAEVYSESEDEDKTGTTVSTPKIKKEVKIAENKSKLSAKVPRINLFKHKRAAVEMSDEDEEMMETSNKKRKLIALEEPVQTTAASAKKKRHGACITEQHILIILSRISQMYDPSKHLMTSDTICCCLDYLALVDKPEKRMARTLCRIILNPLCLKSLLDIHMPLLIYHKLLKNVAISYGVKILKSFLRSKHESLKNIDRRDPRGRSNSLDSTSSQFSFLDIEDSWLNDCPATDKTPEPQKNHDAKMVNTSTSPKEKTCSEDYEDLSFPFRAGLILLQDVSTQVDSPYGRGEVAHCFHKMDPDVKNITIFSLLFALWNTGMTKHYFIKLNFMETIMEHLTSDDNRHSRKAFIEALCFVGHIVFTSDEEPEKSSDRPDLQPVKNISTSDADCKFDNIECKNISFRVQDTIIMGNQEVLVESSDLFKAMLEGHYSESKTQEIYLSNTTPFAARFILHYLHGCDLSCDVLGSVSKGDKSDEALCNLLDAAVLSHRYMLSSVVEFLLCRLIDVLSPENACHVFHFALTYDFPELIVRCVKLMFSSPSVARKVSGFQNFLTGPDAENFMNVLFDLLLERTY